MSVQPFSSYDQIMAAAAKERVKKAEEAAKLALAEKRLEQLHETKKIRLPKPTIVLTLSLVSAVLAASATVISLYYTYEWFSARMAESVAALMTATIVLVVVISPQIIGEFRSRHNRGIVTFLIIIDIVATSYSMITTIGSLYDSQSASYVEYEKTDGRASLIKEAVTNAKERVARAKSDAESLRSDRDRYQAEVIALEAQGDKDSQAHRTAQARYIRSVSAYNEAIKLLGSLEAKQDDTLGTAISESENSAKSERSDFITWVSSFFSFDRKWIELIINGLPAIFTDIVGPLFFRAAILLYRKESE